MTELRVILDVAHTAQAPIKGYHPDKAVEIHNDISVVRFPKGMKSGRSSVAFIAPLPNGQFIFLETSMRNFLLAAEAFKAAEEKQSTEGN